MKKFLLLLLFLLGAWGCTSEDRAIYEREGRTFEHRFRALGGFWVGRRTFRERVTETVGLSPKCAACYAESYMCGKSRCWRSCIAEGPRCERCIVEEGCVQRVKECTGWKE